MKRVNRVGINKFFSLRYSALKVIEFRGMENLKCTSEHANKKEMTLETHLINGTVVSGRYSRRTKGQLGELHRKVYIKLLCIDSCTLGRRHFRFAFPADARAGAGTRCLFVEWRITVVMLTAYVGGQVGLVYEKLRKASGSMDASRFLSWMGVSCAFSDVKSSSKLEESLADF
uniref:Transmembrane protein n=1 Tax=Steinernema glaseri TaxID=37863 RepID=A0A1I7XWJ7_9BILA